MAGDQLVFNGVGFVEAQERVDEYRTGSAPSGTPPTSALLGFAPSKRTNKVFVQNVGEQACELRLKHAGGPTKTQTAENLTALTSGLKVFGQLQFGKLVPGSLSITNAGAPPTVVDDGLGGLWDVGFIGVAGHSRGTINYLTGALALTYGAAITQPVAATYQHADYTDFASPAQPITGGAHALPYTISVAPGGNGSIPFGRMNPNTITFTDGVTTWIDDGKGNIIETVGVGAVQKVGTVDYMAGVITITTGPAVAGALSGSYTFNPFAQILQAGGSSKLLDGQSQIPELTNAAWGNGVKNDPNLGLFGVTRVTESLGANPPFTGAAQTSNTNLVTQWTHWGEEPYRVTMVLSSFPPGGSDNDPTLLGFGQPTAHL
jgi:hypothetical protein